MPSTTNAPMVSPIVSCARVVSNRCSDHCTNGSSDPLAHRCSRCFSNSPSGGFSDATTSCVSDWSSGGVADVFTSGSPNTKQLPIVLWPSGIISIPLRCRLVRCRIPAKRRPKNEHCSGSLKKICRRMCPILWRNGSDLLWRPCGLPMVRSMIVLHRTHTDTWLSSTDECGWASVETCVNGEVTRLWLNFDGLSGSIPADVGLLTALTYL